MDLDRVFQQHAVTWIKSINVVIYFMFKFVITQKEGELRLVGGACQMQGRIEIFHSGIWGTVCDNGFGYNDAVVVCRQLGSSSWTNVQFYTSDDGVGKIWLDGLACSGTETELSRCGHSGWDNHNCNHHADVGVWCFDASDGDLRLIGGADNGRLEIYHINSWGTICDDQFTKYNAEVACRQLGLRSTNAAFYTAGNGTGMIWLDDINCTKTAPGLDMCKHKGWGIHNCGHSEDVGVRCYGSFETFTGDLRLVGGDTSRDGRLEVYYNGQWGTVCDDDFNIVDARVACRQLRYSTDAAEIYKHGGASSNTKIWMDEVNCAASHTRLENCGRSSWGVNDCSHNEDIGIKCFGKYIVNGNLGEWSVWSLCSASCGHATQHRQRLCNSPIPSAGGSDCNEMVNQEQNCTILKCPVDGDWSEWSSWNLCSATCNGGIQDRTRQCNAPQPSNGGLYCNGTTILSRPCNNIFCEIHGQWGQWQEWNFCNTTCGNGFQNRSRECDSPYPMFGGSECIGHNFDIQVCSRDTCAGAQQQIKDKSSNSFSAGFVGGIAVGCIVITAVIIFIALLILRRFNPEKVLKSKRNERRNDDLSQLRITSQPNEYECTGRSIGTQSGVYDTCSNTEVVTAQTQCNTGTIDSGTYSNSQFNADSNEELYENLKVQ